MLRPKSDSTRAMAASNCQGTPQPDSRAARSMVARWSAVSLGTNACQSRAASSVVAASWSVGSGCGDGLGCGVGVAEGWGLGVDVPVAVASGRGVGVEAGVWVDVGSAGWDATV